MTYLFFVYAVDIQTDVHINVLFLNLFYVKITLFNKDKMLEKVLKIKDFYPLLRCSNTTHSTCDGLVDQSLEVFSLFDDYDQKEKENQLEATIDTIRDQFGVLSLQHS